MKLADLKKGVRARKAIALQFGELSVPVDVRVLGPDDDIDIAAAALAFAKSKGVTDPCPGEEIYDKAVRAETLVRALVDHDSPEDAPAPFVTSAAELLGDKLITRDHIAFLIEEQERFQDAVSPRRRELSTAEYISMVAKTAEGDIGPFAACAPGLQWSFVHTMARQLIGSQTDRSPTSSSAEGTQTN